MRIVSENSDADLARNGAEEQIEWALRELTANLFRVTRGAGRAEAIGTQAIALLQAFEKFREATGFWPSADKLSAMLKIEDAGCADDKGVAQHAMVRGALQIAASHLVGQPTQEAAGRSQMMDGFIELEAIREANRKARQAAERAQRAATKRKPAKRPKRAAPKAKA